MSDDCISSMPKTPRCPVCDGATATAPGAVCPACGGTFDAASPLPVPDLRLPEETGWLWGHEKQVYNLIGGFALILVALSAFFAPRLFIFLAVLLVPAGIRTIRIATRSQAEPARSFAAYLFGTLIASFGVAVLAGTVAAVVSRVICWVIVAAGNGLENLGVGLIVGAIVGLGLFVLIFVRLWPRESDDDKRQRSPDPRIDAFPPRI